MLQTNPEGMGPDGPVNKLGARITKSPSITKGTLADLLLDDLGVELIAEGSVAGPKSI